MIYNGKYEKLTHHLDAQDSHSVPMTFKDIEGVLDFPLPRSAWQYQAWWANQDRGHSLAWQSAGFVVTALSVEEERLTFLKREHITEHMEEPSSARDEFIPLTIAEAKDRLALTLGIDPSQIEITIRA